MAGHYAVGMQRDRYWWPEPAGSVRGWENAICQDLRLRDESASKWPEWEPSGSLLKQLGGGGHSVLCGETAPAFHLLPGPLASNRVLTLPGSGSPHVEDLGYVRVMPMGPQGRRIESPVVRLPQTLPRPSIQLPQAKLKLDKFPHH